MSAGQPGVQVRVGAVLVPGAAAPKLVTRDMLPRIRQKLKPIYEQALERYGHLPVRVGAGPAHTEPPVVRIRGDVSSQYVTALMLIGPYLAHGLRIERVRSRSQTPMAQRKPMLCRRLKGFSPLPKWHVAWLSK